ncbi:hypothetical protein OQY15_01400 [Pedobacter sp. MC2016-15]|uniref:hypothetical protein n=1 Tax=Pedobacter sp. MC2016-15 TaxID=2994473 RepID=UPI0022460ED5|nr:hypothetical protein [Pedobacter sp. MC2016-15]MCX2477724.1 hypothetical protein [Pedobacter sp. MC2016-15]
MPETKKAIFTHSKTGEVKIMTSYADASFVKKKLAIAKEILKDVKLPDHWLTK